MKQTLMFKKIIYYNSINSINNLYKKNDPWASVLTEKDTELMCAQMVGNNSFIVLDFGKEMHGGIRFISGWVQEGSCKVRIRFGESYGEVNSSIKEKNATNDCSPRDFEYVIPAYGDISVGQTGFRFVRIDILEDKYIFIKNIFCINNILSLKTIYKYEGEDKLIKKIFLTAKRTIDLCASGEVIWDGIKRDRLLWVGDLSPEVMALTTLYGECKVIENSISRAAKMFPLPRYMNDIFTYSLWWLIILGMYYKETNKKEFVKTQLKYLEGLIKQLDSLIKDDLILPETPLNLIDWPTVGSEDEAPGRMALLILSLKSINEIFDDFNLDRTNLDNLINKTKHAKITVKHMKQIVGLKFAATGNIDDEEYQILIKDGAKGFSTFMSYYILKAIASRDEALAIDLMKQYYGAMLSRGATTFFEDFDMDWLKNSSRIDKKAKRNQLDLHGDFGKHCYVGYRHSLCHGWSTGVIKFIKEHCK